MIVLHGSWLPESGGAAARFALWGETAQLGTTKPRPRGRPRKGAGVGAHPHPFAATTDALAATSPVSSLAAKTQALAIIVRLPTVAGEPVPSRPFLRESAAKGQPSLSSWAIPALAFAPDDALALLAGLPLEDDTTPGLDIGADLRFWSVAARFALELLAGQRFAPILLDPGDLAGGPLGSPVRGDRATGRYLARWLPLLDAPGDRERLDQLAAAMPPASRALAREPSDPDIAPRVLLSDFLQAAVDAVARQAADFNSLLPSQPLHVRAADPAQSWLAGLATAQPLVFAPPAFAEQYRSWAGEALSPTGNFRICFRLDPPDAPDSDGLLVPKASARDWALRYFLQARDDPSLLVPAEAVWRERGSALTFLNQVFDQPQEQLLAGLGRAAGLFPPIEESLKSARPEACALSAVEAYTFIREVALLLQASGFGVLLPGLRSGLNVRAKLAPQRKGAQPKGGVASLDFQSIVQFNWELALGEQPLSHEEFQRLAALKVPLVQIRGQWVELRPDQIEQALAMLKRRDNDSTLSLSEALRLALAPGEVAGMSISSVETEGWFGDLLHELNNGVKLQALPQPEGLQGSLRHYQRSGFAWLEFLGRYGLGACLADDMGLGKSIETLAFLLHQKNEGEEKPSIIICPTSVVSNWRREVERFAPSLRVLVHHGAQREKDNFVEQASQHDLVISSYALLHRDEEQFMAVDWAAAILDEAQNIKNPATKQAQAARKLPSARRIALTGTPVENRLAELWSIFQFLNPGYLGKQSDFQAQFAKPIERMQDPEAAQRLKALVGPFILRRLKTDPTVISDLPEKNEIKVFCNLTREQATLYQAVVRDSLQKIEESDGIERRGVVLATLLKLKQVCNHPAQFLKDDSALPDRSGKLERLVEMLEEVRSVKERVLIFTQFAEMGHMLKAHTQAVFGDEALFLYGQTPAKQREAMVQRFQEDPHGPFVFILSIKAGGVGLNLTRANHVFHFDRWWNPAVENQATDRAFRIGQTRQVQVYKYLCAGTMEERIDEMIERKRALADQIVGTSEAWITELSTDQLHDLFALRQDALGD